MESCPKLFLVKGSNFIIHTSSFESLSGAVREVVCRVVQERVGGS